MKQYCFSGCQTLFSDCLKNFLSINNTSTKPLESDYSNAKLEAKNMLSKDIKRQGFGFQNF